MDRDAKQIPFNRPSIVGRELEYVAQSVAAMHTSGDGPFTERCREALQTQLGVQTALLTPSCTAALEMTALLSGIEPGDEVIVPSFTFVSAVNAYVMRGAVPVFADIRGDTLNLDESLLDSLVTPRTRAVVLTHYAGVACEMDPILAGAERHGIQVVEDNAHGLYGSYRGRKLGSLAPLATLSFHETKNLICGEGGALLINDAALVERAEIIRDKGTDRQRFFRGQVDKYSWVDLGASHVLSDMLAAFLYAQLECREQVMQQRGEVWQRYDAAFRGEVEQHGVRLPTVPEHCEQAYHMYYMLLPTLARRQALIAHLRQRNIHAVFHYVPLHQSTMGRKLGRAPDGCPTSCRVSDTLVRLPFFHGMDAGAQQRVIDEVLSFLAS